MVPRRRAVNEISISQKAKAKAEFQLFRNHVELNFRTELRLPQNLIYLDIWQVETGCLTTYYEK